MTSRPSPTTDAIDRATSALGREDAPDAPRGGQGRVEERDGPEASDAMAKVWSEPGGEAMSYRNAMVGAGGKTDNHSDLVAAETPETHRHLSDASLPSDDKAPDARKAKG